MASSRATSSRPVAPRWLHTGAEAYERMLPALEGARTSVRMEFYIYRADDAGNRFRAALEQAAARGAHVRVLLDAFGAVGLPADYWAELRARGGEVRIFNPFSLRFFALRNHRKLLLVDDQVAFVGGFNIGHEYDGDGVKQGWRDLGMELHTPAAVQQLGAAFDDMFTHCRAGARMMSRVRQSWLPRAARGPVLLSGPRMGRNPFRTHLLAELATAKHVQIVSGYFLPSLRLRQKLRAVVRRGGTVELLLAGRSDVPVAQVAGRARYGSLLRAGVRIFEYQPQILHAKLAIIDGVVFVGSSNLDTRSFGINYELMVRFDDDALAASGRRMFAADRAHSTEVTLESWHKQQTWIRRLRGLWAGFLLTKVDPWLAHRQLRSMS